LAIILLLTSTKVKASYKKTNKRIDYDTKFPLSEEIDETYLEVVARASAPQFE
jgi:hypothetical protein